MGSIAPYLDPSLWGERLHESLNGLQHTTFWVGVLQILLIDVLLSGDNAVVIAMACRALAPRQRFWGLAIGVTLAVLLRIIFAAVLTQLVQLPYLELIAGVALLYIGAKLLAPGEPDKNNVRAASGLWGAVGIIIVADTILSIDNILPIAVVARGDIALLVIGLAGAIPLIVAGAALMMRLLDRFPILLWAGAALLGWIAGDVMAADPVVSRYLIPAFGESVAWRIEIAAALAGALLVLLAGAMQRRAR